MKLRALEKQKENLLEDKNKFTQKIPKRGVATDFRHYGYVLVL